MKDTAYTTQDDLVRHRFDKAERSISNDVPLMIKNNLWSIAVDRLHISCHFAASAVLINMGIDQKYPEDVKQMFDLHFINAGKINKENADLYTRLFEMRQDSDYEDFVDYEEGDVIPLIAPTKAFINEIRSLLFTGK